MSRALAALAFLRVVLQAVASVPLGLIAPDRCAACDARVSGTAFCPPCASSVVRLPLAPVAPGGAIAPFAYGGAIAVAIRRFKYGGRADLARPLGHLLRVAAQEARPSVDLVVQVPLHARRRVERGFDQAGLLAAHVAAGIARPHASGVARRVRHGPPQASLSRRERLASEALVFAAEASAVRGARILLVDDVVTTGATLRACRAALLAAGAARVSAICLARAEGQDGDGPSAAGADGREDRHVVGEPIERALLPERSRALRVEPLQRG